MQFGGEGPRQVEVEGSMAECIEVAGNNAGSGCGTPGRLRLGSRFRRQVELGGEAKRLTERLRLMHSMCTNVSCGVDFPAL